MAKGNQCEVVIVGGGPAGLTAGIYLSRARIKTRLVEKAALGGKITNALNVENYPGFPEGISGLELGNLMGEQAKKFGLEVMIAEVTRIEPEGEWKTIETTEGALKACAVVLASGSEPRKLGVPGEEKFTGRGVSYCATCDAAFFRDRPVAVVGGGDSAITEALHLAKFASTVTIIHRRDQLRASRILQERATAETKIKFLWDTVIDEIEGNDFVERIRLRNVKTHNKSMLDVAGVFGSIGIKPSTEYLKGILPLDDNGNVITNNKMQTVVPGIFAAGDIRHDSARQVITAAGDGATAAIRTEEYLTEFLQEKSQ